MTVAIAARSADHKYIFTVSDRTLSFGGDAPAVDNAILKDLIICSGWGALFTADDTSFAIPILRQAGLLLATKNQPGTLTNVSNAMCEAYSLVLEDYITRNFLRKFGFRSVAEFRTTAQSQLGRKLSWSLARKIDGASLNTAFLVYGFDSERKSTHHFEVVNPGYATSLDHIGYYAIGSGCRMAMNSLHLRPPHNLTNAGLIYRLCEAKFSAETADGVGQTTTVFMVGRGDPAATFLSRGTINKFREAWERWRIEPPSDEVLKLIQEI